MATRGRSDQLSLFGDGVGSTAKSRGAAKSVEPAPVAAELEASAAALPAHVRLGTSSWSFPGWSHIVYAGDHSENLLARRGPVVFQFSPDRSRSPDDALRFAEKLEAFLSALPRGPLYAVELRPRALPLIRA